MLCCCSEAPTHCGSSLRRDVSEKGPGLYEASRAAPHIEVSFLSTQAGPCLQVAPAPLTPASLRWNCRSAKSSSRCKPMPHAFFAMTRSHNPLSTQKRTPCSQHLKSSELRRRQEICKTTKDTLRPGVSARSRSHAVLAELGQGTAAPPCTPLLIAADQSVGTSCWIEYQPMHHIQVPVQG